MSITIHTRDKHDHGESLNFSNTNFRRLMDLLGIDAEPYGDWTPYDVDNVIEKITFVLDNLRAMPDLDSGTPGTECGGPGTGAPRIILCGLGPGYYTRRLTELRDLLIDARDNHRAVSWD